MNSTPQDSPQESSSDDHIIVADVVASVGATASVAEPPHALPPEAIPTAEVVRPAPRTLVPAQPPESTSPIEDRDATPGLERDRPSWVFRLWGWFTGVLAHLFGIASVMVLLAIATSIPLVQFAAFGYLLEVGGRLGRGAKMRDAMVGLRKASVLGGSLLGIWLCLIPVRVVSNIWFDAFLIDPTSSQTATLRVVQFAAIFLTVAHIGAALICGGKLRYFFWPLIAPCSLAIWAVRKMAGIRWFRSILNWFCGWVSPKLAADIVNTPPIGDWFLPAIVWKRWRQGHLYAELREELWSFFVGLRPLHYLTLGLKGLVGTLAWLLVPTGLLVISAYTEGATAGITFAMGALIAIPIFAGLPFLQVHFAKEGRLRNFAEPWNVFKNFGRAPIVHTLSLLLILVFSLPLFLLKIETIPTELMWTLALVFVMFAWPAKFLAGLAYRRGNRKDKPAWWIIRYPMVLLTAPISFAFVLILTGTRYVSWYGALSLFENHVFLLPAPFWLG